ncbi:MAG: 2-succinyl-6-hydroxy-2,4-cyclohexadiene-1-carboxylate synthase [Phormidesmis sp.]
MSQALYYTVTGEPSNPPLLLLHGFLGSHRDFDVLLPTLSQHFYCISVDLPGHGKSLSVPDSYTFSGAAIALLTLLDHLHISQTHLLGYSLGGRLALYLRCHYPQRFTRTILESASPGLKTAEERIARRESDEAIAHQLATIPLPDFLAQWYSNPLFVSLQAHRDLYADMLQRRQNNRPAELAKALRGFSLGSQTSLWNCLAQIERPLLLLVGALDSKFVAINHDMLSHSQPSQRVSLKILTGCGHNAHLENPSMYTQAAIGFLKGLP